MPVLGNEVDEFAIEEFLAAEAAKDLLRFSTAGSVDDGKSTLIGRLLYDSRSVYEDQVRAVTGLAGGASGGIDFALLTDGLRAEREQGITIDVAYRYFSTAKRKFIIADTPGHEQYTRNMATGASTADLAIILIDARKGILTQSRRHAYIASLLGTRHLVAAINKMDLVAFSEEVFRRISADFKELVRSFGDAELTVIPVSALEGDNVVERSARMSWYSGPTLLEHLESVPVWTDAAARPFRMAVQRVIRPDQSFRGFAGQISAGTVRRGDGVTALPSGRTSRVASIATFDGELDEASAPLSVAITLEDELDISRGDLLAEPGRPPESATVLEATLVWFDAARLETHRPYLVKTGAQTLPARVARVHWRTNVQTLADEAVNSLGMNEIGVVEVELTRTLFFDAYAENRVGGAFILIDPQTNATLAAGMIRRGLGAADASWTHKPAVVEFAVDAQPAAWVGELEHLLVSEDVAVVRTRVVTEKTLRGLLALGLIVLVDGRVAEASLGEAAVVRAAEFSGVGDLVSHLRDVGVLAVEPSSQKRDLGHPGSGSREEFVVEDWKVVPVETSHLGSAEMGHPETYEERVAAARELVARELAAATGEPVVTNSFQAEDMVLLHMVQQTLPEVPVVFLDTGYHFAEVLAYRDRMTAEWGLSLVSLEAEQTVAEQEALFGILNRTDPGRCCGLRKVAPLFGALEAYGVWFTGLRREQAKSRAALSQVDDFKLPTGKVIRKVSPLTEWSAKDVWTYAAEHGIPLLELYERGYTSIGCEPCTSLPTDPNDPRSGRWGGQKQECGIHVQG